MAQWEWLQIVQNYHERGDGTNFSSEESERQGRNKRHQNVTLPIFENKTIQEAKLWWRRFIKYVKWPTIYTWTTWQRNITWISRRTGSKDQRHIHLGIGWNCSNRNNKNSEITTETISISTNCMPCSHSILYPKEINSIAGPTSPV